jgi:caa(3)-type oxidase subunit IV
MAQNHDTKKPVSENSGHSHHYILPDKLAFKVIGALLFLTVVTVWTAGIDFGAANFPIAMAIATSKALLVALVFMNLRKDSRENGVIFFTSFFFLVIFIVLTSADIFFRGDVYVKGPLTAAAGGKAKFKKPWNATPEILAHGKELFGQQCTSCHGDAGLGNGPAAGGLNPPPRNFASVTGWKNGRKPSQIYKTLKEGIAGGSMASFATLPAEDRWALSGYVASLSPEPQADTEQDLVAVGVDPTKDTMDGGSAAPTIPIQVAMRLMTEEAPRVAWMQPAALERLEESPTAQYYQANCASCHGANAQGAVVSHLGVAPKAFLRVGSISGLPYEAFKKAVIQGLPGNGMPGYGQLTETQLQELHAYVRGLAAQGAVGQR